MLVVAGVNARLIDSLVLTRRIVEVLVTREKGIRQEKEALAREHRLAHQYSYTVDLQPQGSMVADMLSEIANPAHIFAGTRRIELAVPA